jgi:hypothetical protein
VPTVVLSQPIARREEHGNLAPAGIPDRSFIRRTASAAAIAAMRAQPARLILGEVRDEAAIDMIMGLTTGHAGFSTIHGGSCEHGLIRTLQLTRLSGKSTVSARDDLRRDRLPYPDEAPPERPARGR